MSGKSAADGKMTCANSLRKTSVPSPDISGRIWTYAQSRAKTRCALSRPTSATSWTWRTGTSRPITRGVRKLLCDAVSSGRLVPVVNREYSGLPRVAQPDPAPQRWPATLNPLPNLGAPAKVDDDDFDLLGVVESVAGALLGGGDNNSDSGAFEEDAFSSYSVESTPLSDAQPFEYSEDMPEGGSFDIAKTPNEGDPGTWYTNPGSGQMRMYGENGQPVVDFDFDHDHGQGVPHAHNWDNGARGPGVAFSPL